MDVVLAYKVVTTGVLGGPEVERETVSCTTLHLILNGNIEKEELGHLSC